MKVPLTTTKDMDKASWLKMEGYMKAHSKMVNVQEKEPTVTKMEMSIVVALLIKKKKA